MATTDELLVALMKNCKKPLNLSDDTGLLKQVRAKTMEQPKEPEMTEKPDGHLQQNDSGGWYVSKMGRVLCNRG